MTTGQRQEERAARLLSNRGTSGGGLPLPEVFREVLIFLWREKTVPGDVLHKIIQRQVSYKETRILSIWGSWEKFADDILAVLQDGGFLYREASQWAATAAITPGIVLTIRIGRGSVIKVAFHELDDHIARELLGDARQRAEDLIFYLNSHASRHEALGRARNKAVGISDVLTGALAELDRQAIAQPSPQRAQGPAKKERDKPEPPDEPDEMRKCIGICGRTLPLTREYWECYWSRRDWYWRRDCRECHGRAKSTGSSRNAVIRAQRKEELRLRIAELGEPYPSVTQFVADLHMDAANIRKIWRELHEEGKAPPLPPPPPGYPRLPKNRQ